jgi:CDP-diacylglycerol--serine O-phosphatidyltransferase
MDLNRPRRRQRVRRAVVVLPSAFTLGNLFFGFWSIVSASRGNFLWAGWFLVLAGVMDMVDGRVARLSKTDSRFGAELDSLVDVISFGVAPGLLIYHLRFAEAGGFTWMLSFAYAVAVAVRLARFNLAVGGEARTPWFTGLPSPAAGMLIGVYYPFTQTAWYPVTIGRFNQEIFVVILMLLLSVLMVSNVRYPKLPGIGLRTVRGRLGLGVNLGILAGGLLVPEYFFFTFGSTYVAYGLFRAMALGLAERGERHPDMTTDETAAQAPEAPAAPPPSTTRRYLAPEAQP